MTGSRLSAYLLAIALATGSAALAPSSGPFEVAWHTVDGGGGSSTGGGYELNGTAGQPDAGEMSGGGFELAGGYWPGVPSGGVSCPWDCADGGNGDVGITDFLKLLADWGLPSTCDFDGGGVGITDFLKLLANWGPCP